MYYLEFYLKFSKIVKRIEENNGNYAALFVDLKK